MGITRPLAALRRGHSRHGDRRRRTRGRRVDVRPDAGQGRRQLALRPGHRRPRPQRPVRLRRRRPLHRRRPRPRRRGQEADRREDDHQGRREERRAATPSFAPSVYAGPTAKAAVLALSQDKNPRAFGGVDLVKQLEDRVATTAPITGRIEDAYDPSDQFGGDFANVIGQAYAAQALSQAGSAEASAVTAFLLAAAVRQGLLPSVLHRRQDPAPTSPARVHPRAERDASTDATALAVLALQDVKGTTAKVAVDDGRRLADLPPAGQRRVQRHRQGTASSTSTPTAPAWPAGRSARPGATTHAAKAAVAVRALQVGGRQPRAPASSARTSARSPSTSAPTDAAGDKGITKKTSDQWRRASAQALPVLRWAPRAEGRLHGVTAPARVPPGSTFTIRLDGRGPGPARLRRPRRRRGRVRARAATR